jgi:hypothetical protein
MVKTEAPFPSALFDLQITMMVLDDVVTCEQAEPGLNTRV